MIQKKLKDICKASDITYLGLFGSFAVGKQTKDRDVDLLVDFKNTKSLLEKGKILIELQNLFKREIGLVSRKNVKLALKPFNVLVHDYESSLLFKKLFQVITRG